MSRKPFDQETYDKYDKWARVLGVELLTQEGMQNIVDHNPTDGGTSLWDVKGNFPNSPYEIRLDVEVKLIWEDCMFPYSTIHFPERKLKSYKIAPNYHVMFNSEGNRCVWVPRDVILSSKTETCTPSNRNGEEETFSSPEVHDPRLLWFIKINGIWKKAPVGAPMPQTIDLGDGIMVTVAEP